MNNMEARMRRRLDNKTRILNWSAAALVVASVS